MCHPAVVTVPAALRRTLVSKSTPVYRVTCDSLALRQTVRRGLWSWEEVAEVVWTTVVGLTAIG